MFERFTENARRTVFFARYAASNVDSRRLETQHLLQGLLQADSELFAALLEGNPEGIEGLRVTLEAPPAAPGHSAKSIDLPLSVACKRVFSYGSEEAETLRHRHIGTEHLLLGLLRENGPETAHLLERGLDAEKVRHYAVKIYPGADRKKSADLQILHSLLDAIPGERWDAARRLLKGLAQQYFSVTAEASDGTFSYSHGVKPQ